MLRTVGRGPARGVPGRGPQTKLSNYTHLTCPPLCSPTASTTTALGPKDPFNMLAVKEESRSENTSLTYDTVLDNPYVRCLISDAVRHLSITSKSGTRPRTRRDYLSVYHRGDKDEEMKSVTNDEERTILRAPSVADARAEECFGVMNGLFKNLFLFVRIKSKNNIKHGGIIIKILSLPISRAGNYLLNTYMTGKLSQDTYTGTYGSGRSGRSNIFRTCWAHGPVIHDVRMLDDDLGVRDRDGKYEDGRRGKDKYGANCTESINDIYLTGRCAGRLDRAGSTSGMGSNNEGGIPKAWETKTRRHQVRTSRGKTKTKGRSMGPPPPDPLIGHDLFVRVSLIAGHAVLYTDQPP